MVGHPLSRFALILGLLSSSTALSYSEGQTGFTGRVAGESCLACHGSRQYDGMKFRLIEADETTACFTEDGTELQLPLLTAGRTYPAVVEIEAPAAADAPVCPTHNCCDPGDGTNWPPSETETCMKRGGCTADNANDCCQPGLDLCAGPRAGFNAEVLGGGRFAPGEGSRVKQVGSELFETELTHTIPKDVTGGGSWAFQYTAPAGEELTSAVEFWVGANVANGNDFADPADLNSNFVMYAAVEDAEGNMQLPGFCLVCPNGSSPAFGSCCCNSSESTQLSARGTYASFALLSFLGFLVVGRRKKR